jgi:hypothetical protein
MAAPHSRASGRAAAPAVVDLSLARDARRLRDFQARCRAVDEVNRKAVSRLFQTGLIFTRHGARLGRELLLAHQHLLRVSDLLARIGELPSSATAADASALYDEAQTLLSRTAELTARCGQALSRER